MRSDAPTFWQVTPLLDLSWLSHGVSLRTGGVSASPFETLNLGLHVGDDAGAVVANRRAAAEASGFTLDDTVWAEQVHGASVAVVRSVHARRGATCLSDALPGVDALVSDQPGLLLGLLFADCMPVLFSDPRTRSVGVAHAGWRGLGAGVLENTVAAMVDAFGAEPANLLAAVGPCIGPCCFEVGEDVAARFAPRLRSIRSNGRPAVDLPRVAAEALAACGVLPSNTITSGECTSCRPDRYFSHRRDNGQTGRMAAFVGVRRPCYNGSRSGSGGRGGFRSAEESPGSAGHDAR